MAKPIRWPESGGGRSLSDLPPMERTYTLVYCHLETLSSSLYPSPHLTQLAASTVQGQLFRPIVPPDLNKYLDGCKLGGDLLLNLNMTRDEDGDSFLFRRRFEAITAQTGRVECVSEEEALEDFFTFLEAAGLNIILVCVDEDTVSVLLGKLKSLDRGRVWRLLSGFTWWRRSLKYLAVQGYRHLELESFHQATFPSCPRPSLPTALVVASMLNTSVTHLARQHPGVCLGLTAVSAMFKAKARQRQVEEGREVMEIYNSFRPDTPTFITVDNLEQVEIVSDSDETMKTAEAREPELVTIGSDSECEELSLQGSSERQQPATCSTGKCWREVTCRQHFPFLTGPPIPSKGPPLPDQDLAYNTSLGIRLKSRTERLLEATNFLLEKKMEENIPSKGPPLPDQDLAYTSSLGIRPKSRTECLLGATNFLLEKKIEENKSLENKKKKKKLKEGNIKKRETNSESPPVKTKLFWNFMTNGKMVVCPICQTVKIKGNGNKKKKVKVKMENIEKHIQTVHGNKQFGKIGCSSCGAARVSPANVAKHRWCKKPYTKKIPTKNSIVEDEENKENIEFDKTTRFWEILNNGMVVCPFCPPLQNVKMKASVMNKHMRKIHGGIQNMIPKSYCRSSNWLLSECGQLRCPYHPCTEVMPPGLMEGHLACQHPNFMITKLALHCPEGSCTEVLTGSQVAGHMARHCSGEPGLREGGGTPRRGEELRGSGSKRHKDKY